MEKKKKILYGIAALAAAGAVGYYLYQKKNSAQVKMLLPAGTSEPTQQQAVSLPAAIAQTQPIQQQQIAASLPSVQELNSKTWSVNGTQYPGSQLNIRYNSDGSVLIGSGYRGYLVGNTIVTQERNGAADPKKTWTPLNGLGNAFSMNFQ